MEHEGCWELDTLSLFAQVHAQWLDNEPPGLISRRFHLGLMRGLTELCARLSQQWSCPTVALSGGVMQNLTLARELPRLLADQGLHVLTHRSLAAQ